MYKTILIQRLSFCTLYKLLSIGMATAIIFFTILSVVCNFFAGDENITIYNGYPVKGLHGVITGLFVSFSIFGMFTLLIGTFTAIGLWIYSKFNYVSITVLIADDETEHESQEPSMTQA